LRKKKSSFLRALEAVQEAARQQPAPEETNEDAETPRRPPWLANKKRGRLWK
jgi:hypothetical protein